MANQFDFKKYNEVMQDANSGLKLFLAEQLLLDVQSTMIRFQNPLGKDLIDITTDVSYVRSENKKLAAKRENSGNTESIDNATLPDGEMSKKSTSADAGKVDATV